MFAFKDMEKMPQVLDAHHLLLIVITSVHQLESGQVWDQSREGMLEYGDVEG